MKIIELKDVKKHPELLEPNDLDIKVIGDLTNSDIEYFKGVYANVVDASEANNVAVNVDLKSFKGIKHLYIPNNVPILRDFAFSFCEVLETVYVSEGIKTIGEQAFCYSNQLKRIDVDEKNENFSSLDGVLYNKDKTELIRCPEGIYDKFTVPEGVERIAEHAFYGCNGLKNIYLPKSLKEIGKYAFQQCEGLLSIEIPNNVEIIRESTFFGCTNLDDIKLPASVKEVHYNAFFGCSSLLTINLPKNLKVFETAFERCPNIASFNIEGNVGEYFYSSNGVLFNKQTNELVAAPPTIRECTLPKDIEFIGKKAFESTTIKNIVIGNTKAIKERAFRTCYELKEIILPETLERLEDRTFDSCTNLRRITCLATTPPHATHSSFMFMFYDETTIFVPAQSIEQYKSATGWSLFKNIKAI